MSFKCGENKMQKLLGLDDMSKIKYQNVFDQIRQYQYCDDIVGLNILSFTKKRKKNHTIINKI